MKVSSRNLSGVILLFCLVLQGCGNMTSAQPTNSPQPTQPATTIPTVVEETSTPTQSPIPSMTSMPTQIQHVAKPETPSYITTQQLDDCVEEWAYIPGQPLMVNEACDNADARLIERPTTSEKDSYFPYLDIVRTQFGGTSSWYFGRIVLDDDDLSLGGDGDLYYFFKLDLNSDGRDGNVVLISVKNLPENAANWTTDGVQAWSYVDGTTTIVFDQGVGTDPDLAWVRRSSNNSIELAFKPDLLSGSSRFAWWAWAYQGNLTPIDIALGDSAAGLYQIDNTCALGFNTQATGLPNLCMK